MDTLNVAFAGTFAARLEPGVRWHSPMRRAGFSASQSSER
jgi:hypothetical protein